MLIFLDFSLRLLLALVLGAFIGIERSLRRRMAGLKTNSLVAMGAALFVMYSINIPGEGSPTRVAAQVVSGIGFLGAGVILRDGWNVRGLTTAATIWCSAAIGVLCGSGFYLEAVFATFVIVFANVAFKKVEDRFQLKKSHSMVLPYEYKLYVSFSKSSYAETKTLLIKLIEENGFQLKALHRENLQEENLSSIIADVLSKYANPESLAGIIKQLALESNIERAYWQETDFAD